MKRSTKKMIFVIFILITFIMSSIAFVVINLGGGLGNQQQAEIKPLETFIVEGDIDPRLEQAYLQGGFTFLKYYRSEKNEDVDRYLDTLPDLTITTSNQKQLFVQKINSSDTKMIIRGPYGETLLTTGNITRNSIFETLCRTLLVTPIECVLNVTS